MTRLDGSSAQFAAAKKVPPLCYGVRCVLNIHEYVPLLLVVLVWALLRRSCAMCC